MNKPVGNKRNLAAAVSNRWKTACRWLPIIGTFLAAPAFAQYEPVCGTNETAHLARALAALNMTTNDLDFDKDHGEPKRCLPWVRDALNRPLLMARKGEELLKAAAGSDEAIWDVTGKLLAVDDVVTNSPSREGRPDWNSVDRNLIAAINEFNIGALMARQQLEAALSDLDTETRGWMAAAMFSQLLRADRGDVKALLKLSGVSDQAVARAIAEEKAFDPEPSVTNLLAAAKKFEPTLLFISGRTFQNAVRELARVAATVTNWPAETINIELGCGPIIVLSPGDNVVTNRALLILSREGNTTYKSAPSTSSTPSVGPGAANGLLGQPLAAIIDLGGDDRYEAEDALGPGGALFGVSVVYDMAGDDVYKARNLGQGAAFFGISWVEDAKGDDRYDAWAYSQGAAACGFAMLRDREGNDIYNIGVCGQGFAGFEGVGMLVDDAGNDRYLAGNREVDWDRNSGRFLSLSQGFSIGIRGFAGGGVGALIDRAGNDTYCADVYGQGAGYWYSAGFLLDCGGNDNYTVYQYGQGSGIHLALGMLADFSGNDRYTGYILSQGAGHDFGVGMLFDHAGDDTYSADHHSQGRALNNGLGLLCDSAGDDGYFARQNHRAQGIGNNGGYREYGSLAMLLDLNGNDQFSCGAKNGDRLLRPLYGIVYDASNAPPAKGETR